MSALSHPPLLFSVVIPTAGRNEALIQCLERLSPGRQMLDASSYEVIVSDDGRGTTSEGLVRDKFPWVTWTQGPAKGPAANRNHGVSRSCGEWVVFTDDDCQPEPDWLKQFSLFTGGAEGALEGAVLPLADIHSMSDLCPVNDQGDLFWSANIAICRTVYDRIGGFCELFPYPAAEDQDLYIRIQTITKCRFVAAAVVRHPVVSQNLKDLWRKIPKGVYSHLLLRRRHSWKLGPFTGFQLVKENIMYQLRVMVRSIMKGDRKGIIKALFHLSWGSIQTIVSFQKIDGKIVPWKTEPC